MSKSVKIQIQIQNSSSIFVFFKHDIHERGGIVAKLTGSVSYFLWIYFQKSSKTSENNSASIILHKSGYSHKLSIFNLFHICACW